MKRIVVIGKSGAGKSTFSDKLAAILKCDATHLDDLFWKSGWERVYTANEWMEKMETLVAEDAWILDGNYHNTLPIRLSRADTVVFFDINPVRSLIQALKRKYFDKPEGSIDIHQLAGTGKMVRKIFTFPTKLVYGQIKDAGVKDVHIVKNRRDADRLLDKIMNCSL